MKTQTQAAVLALVFGLPGCFDFDKIYDFCLDDPESVECINAGVGGSAGGTDSGGNTTTGGVDGAGTGGIAPITGGAAGSGGTSTGGSGGSGGTPSLGRLVVNELDPGSFAELYNAGTGAYDLTGHVLYRLNNGTTYDVGNPCPLGSAGTLGSGDFLYVQAGACGGSPACLSCADFALRANDGMAVHDASASEVDRAVIASTFLSGYSWQCHPDGSSADWQSGLATIGASNGP